MSATVRTDLAQRIVAQWAKTLPQASLSREPFDHVYFDKLFPDDIYPQVLANLPPSSVYEPINIKRWVNSKGESTRDRFQLCEEDFAKLDPVRREFWTQLTLAFTSETLKRLIFQHLKGDMALRLNINPEEVLERDVFVSASLLRDVKDYRIAPHPDGQPRLVTMQFYLPPDESLRDLGTSMYVEQPFWKRMMMQRYREEKRMNFMPNSGYCFAVNDRKDKKSLHGRELITKASAIRDTILVCWYSEAPTKAKSATPIVERTHNRVAA